MIKLSKIVSGGQTGVDRAGLDAALAQGFSCGGWCPEGRLAEDGEIPDRYPVTVLPGAGYEERTLKNLINSDGTLIVYFEALSGGTLETQACCNDRDIPVLAIDASRLSVDEAVAIATAFLLEFKIETLNVAGPRASKQAEAHEYAFNLFTYLIAKVTQDDSA